MDPRRKLDGRLERVRSSRVPFIHVAKETAIEEQGLGVLLEREIFVIRVDKAYLKLYTLISIFVITVILMAIFGETLS